VEKIKKFVTDTSLRLWLAEAVKKCNSTNFYEIFESQLALHCPQIAEKLYQKGKSYFQWVMNPKNDLSSHREGYVDKGKEKLEIYGDLVIRGLPVGRSPEEDRHLYYLWKLEEENPMASESAYKKLWEAWKVKYGTKEPPKPRRR